jgi:hypothetical protein
MNEIVKKKSFLKYIIAVIFILILISIALLIYVLTRKKGVKGVTYISQNNTTAKCPYSLGLSSNDSNENSVKAACDLDPSCVGYYTNSATPPNWFIATKTEPSKCTEWIGDVGAFPVYKSKASGYQNSVNNNPDKKFGCPYHIGLSTSDRNEDAVKATCDVDPSCAGYYKSSDWSIATKIDPSKCDEKGVSGYTTFYKKNPPPPPPKVGTYTEISNSAPSKRAYACFDSYSIDVDKTEDVQRVLCDNDDDCQGYYFNPTTPGGGIVYTIDKKCTDTTETNKIDGYNIIKLKDNNYASSRNPKRYGSMSCTKNFFAARLSKPGAEDIIKKICNELPTCKGYYKNKNAFIASKKLLSEIESDDDSVNSLCFDYDEGQDTDDNDYETEYPYFMKKEV